MQHPETLEPQILRQMCIKELRQREEFLKEQTASYTILVSSGKSLITTLPVTIENLERAQHPPESSKAVVLAGQKNLLAYFSGQYPTNVVKLQTSEDELAAVHRELEWRQAERQLSQRGALLAAPSAILGSVPKGKAR